MSTLPAIAVVQMDLVHTVDIHNDKVVPRGRLRDWASTIRPVPVAELNAQPEVLECSALES
jgi:hypothetical protein